MPRPRITAGREGAVLRVRVQPRASRNGVVGLYGEALKVALTAPPVDGAANAALLKLLGKACHVPRSSLCIVRGETGRDKWVEFTTLDVEELGRRVDALC